MSKRYVSGRHYPLHKGRFLLGGMLIGAVIVMLGTVGPHFFHGEDAFAKHAVSGDKTALLPLKKAPMHAGLAQSTDPSLQKLAEYEQVYGGAVANSMMIFAGLPDNSSDASSEAIDMASKLEEFARFHITPLVVMEPTVNGSSITLIDFSAGKYDAPLADYFNDLKAQGITDATMGTWLPFPEDNIPDWGNTDPKVFQTNVVKFAKIQKAVFPTSQLTLMLNSQSFQSDDVDRNYGTFSSLVPYVQGLPKGMFSSFGLQGFPWISAANATTQASLTDPAEFLNADLAVQAARSLGVKQIWFNTGTFQTIYNNDPSEMVTFTASQRQAMLESELKQVKIAQADGFKVAVNLFSYNSSSTDEATDWSYWHTGQTPAQAPGEAVFKSFAEQVHSAGIDLWLFDSN